MISTNSQGIRRDISEFFTQLVRIYKLMSHKTMKKTTDYLIRNDVTEIFKKPKKAKNEDRKSYLFF